MTHRMTGLRFARLALGVAALASTAGSPARAGFSYTSTPTITSITGGALGGSSVTLTGVSSTTDQTTPTNENLFNVKLTSSTSSPGTDTFTVNFSDTITITNNPPPGDVDTNSLTITGSITFTRSDSSGEMSMLSMTLNQKLSFQVDGEVYTLSGFSYAQPSVNSTGGNVSALITSVTVPEPASAALVALGVAGLGGLSWRRRSAR